MKGKFIVIDGTDGSGKTTQANLLIDRLKKSGRNPQMADFPQYNTKSAGMVEEYLSGKYKNPEERKKYWDWLLETEYNFFKIPKPDLSIILHVNSEISQQLSINRAREDWKGKTKDIHEENLGHLKSAEKSYLEIAKPYSDFSLIECIKNDQIMSREYIASLVWTEVEDIL